MELNYKSVTITSGKWNIRKKYTSIQCTCQKERLKEN